VRAEGDAAEVDRSEADMKCPHCGTTVHPDWIQDYLRGAATGRQTLDVREDADGRWFVKSMTCPACKRSTILLRREWRTASRGGEPDTHEEFIMAWPRGIARPLPPEVPPDYAADLQEAGRVLDAGSPKASAALSRRCLQRLLREKAATKSRDLADQIDEVIPTLPSHYADTLHSVRQIGNFGAHPIKSTITGAIIEVEPGEADWLLEALEGLFDHYFVSPARSAARTTALEAKLRSAGKSPVKRRQPPPGS
jgi:uncharacterized protein DUF4145